MAKKWGFPALLLALVLALSLAPISAFAADSTVSNEAELKAALKNADCAEIKLGGNIETTYELDVERTVTLDLNGYTLSCSGTDEDIIRVRSSGSLTIKDSSTGGKIDGQNKNCGIEVKGGTLTLESGSIVNCTDADGDGGAVDVSNTGVTETQVKYGKFIMNGGAIMDCKAGDDGGAVDIGSGCTFIMNGGTISSCRADDDGGAVFIKQSGSFELNGGVIQNCSAGANGGAVNIYQDGRFTMTGGTIKSCKVDLGGLGMAVYGSNDKAVVTMTGGTFEDCGAYPYSFDDFTVTFDSDGGSAVAEQKVMNAPAVKPADPKKDSYDFAGWYLGDTQYTFDTKVTGNITLKAHWTPTSGGTTTGGYYYSPSTPTITAALNGAATKSATDYSGGIYGLTFKSSASFASFQGVQVDGKALDKSNYIAEEGSIEVYLKAVYLQTLAAGKHTDTILSSEGNATAEFTIGGSSTSPKTADAGVALYAAAALLSTAGLAWSSKRRGQ